MLAACSTAYPRAANDTVRENLDAMYILANNKTYTNLTQLSVPSEIVMKVDCLYHEDP